MELPLKWLIVTDLSSRLPEILSRVVSARDGLGIEIQDVLSHIDANLARKQKRLISNYEMMSRNQSLAELSKDLAVT